MGSIVVTRAPAHVQYHAYTKGLIYFLLFSERKIIFPGLGCVMQEYGLDVETTPLVYTHYCINAVILLVRRNFVLKFVLMF